jgi:RNA polymerase sigma-70 factor (ECF subfamily)
MALIEAARYGDAEAFGVLVKHYMPKALSYARQMTGGGEAAEDLVQDAFLKAYKGLGGFKGESSFYTWFFRVLSNICLDHLRKATFLKKVFLIPAVSDEDDEPGQLEQSPDPNTSWSRPDERLNQKELRAALSKALKILPERQRAVFLLKNNEGMKITEIAAVLNISEGAVKSHLVRAITSLRKHMKGYGRHV